MTRAEAYWVLDHIGNNILNDEAREAIAIAMHDIELVDLSDELTCCPNCGMKLIKERE